MMKNIVKGPDDLKKIVNDETTSLMDNKQMDIDFSPKIFLHTDEERRVTYNHIRAFYQKSKHIKLDDFEFIYYFGHALKGKDPKIYKTPISRDINDVKKEVFNKIDLKALGANQGKKIKQLKKMVEQKYIDNFQKTHFGITPLTPGKFKDICMTMKVDPKELHYNEFTGMINNACMSPHCAYYFQPMKVGELIDHMRLWRKTLPTRFHSTVANLLKEKKGTEDIYEYLIKSGELIPKKHKKSKEEVLEYIETIRKAFNP